MGPPHQQTACVATSGSLPRNLNIAAVGMRGSGRQVSNCTVKYFLAASALLAMTFLLYYPVGKFAFLTWDDGTYVVDNPHVRSGLSLANAVWAFSSVTVNWHPLTWLTHMLDCQFFGLSPAGPHFVNLLLHAANVLLLFFLLWKATGYVGRSFVVSACFALHPLNVESVAWVAERKNVLSTLFILLTIWSYGWYVKSPNLKRYLLVVATFVAALMSKPMAVTLPFALLLFDYWPLERWHIFPQGSTETGQQKRFCRSPLLRLAIEKLPLLVLSAAASWITLIAQNTGGAMATGASIPFSARLGNAIVSYAEYMSKMFWPAGLSAFYPYRNSLPSWKIAVAAFVLSGITALVLKFRRRRYLVVGWLFFLGTLVPVIGLVQVGEQAMADRYVYVPLIGLFVIVVWLASEWIKQVPVSPVFQAAGTIVLILAMGLASRFTLGFWNNAITVFTRAEAVAGKPNATIENNLGTALVIANRIDEGLEHYRLAASVAPSDAMTHFNIGILLTKKGQPEEAAQEFQAVIRNSDSESLRVHAFTDLGLVEQRLGNLTEASESYSAALRLDPRYSPAMFGRGKIFYRQLRYQDATEEFSRALSISPNPEGFLWLGKAYEAQKDLQRALAAYRFALQIDPGLIEARNEIQILSARQ